MRKIIAATFLSLDGVMQAPGGPREDTEGGFEHGGWVAPHFDEALGASVGELFEKPFDLLLGRKTYDIFAAHWPRAETGEDAGLAKLFNATTKHVATRSNKALAWNNSRSLGPDVVAALTTLKAGDGPDLLIQGSGNLIQTLLPNNLIDEFKLLIFPVLLGKGKRLFGEGVVPAGLKLTASRSFPSGVVSAWYVPDGEAKTGSFELPPEA
jgi:dihydrofolate reductase